MQVHSKQLSDDKSNFSQPLKLVKISICIATYKRPHLLQELLSSLDSLTFSKISTPVIEVIVVDNDSTGSARPIIEDIKSSFQWPLKYFVEGNQGVTYARNRCVNEASNDSDFIAMLDDDETATSQWLEELLISQQKFNADIVTGPSLAVYKEDQQVPDWIKSGRFYSFPRYETGKRMDTAFTNNVMFSTKILENTNKDEPLFDNRFAQNGAEDAYLFSCLNKQGYKIIWADNAVLHEPVAEERLSLNWILNRGFWSWSVHSFIEAELYPSFKTQSIRVIKGLGLILIGAVTIGPSLFLGRARVARALLRIFRGMGTLSGLLGRQGSWR